MDWARILAYVTRTVDQELLVGNEYLATENRILKAQLTGRLKLSDSKRKGLGEIGHRLGGKALADVATVARPDTILGWYRKLVACKFDGSKSTPRQTAHQARGRAADRSHGRRGTGTEIMTGSRGRWPIWATRFPIKRSATSCDATVCHRRRSASARAHGQPSFGPIWRCWRGPTSSEVPTLRGLVTYYVLFYIHLERRRVDIAGLTAQRAAGLSTSPTRP
jgi:hypothetical protein